MLQSDDFLCRAAFVGECPLGDGGDVGGFGVALRGDGDTVVFAGVGVPVGADEEREHRCLGGGYQR